MAQRVRPGDELLIPLPAGGFAFCRVLRDASLAVYDHKGRNRDALPAEECSYLFVVPVEGSVVTSGDWPRIRRVPFPTEDAGWPPPYVVIDSISGAASIYERGALRPAEPGEWEALELAALWGKEELLARIVAELK